MPRSPDMSGAASLAGAPHRHRGQCHCCERCHPGKAWKYSGDTTSEDCGNKLLACFLFLFWADVTWVWCTDMKCFLSGLNFVLRLLLARHSGIKISIFFVWRPLSRFGPSSLLGHYYLIHPQNGCHCLCRELQRPPLQNRCQ